MENQTIEQNQPTDRDTERSYVRRASRAKKPIGTDHQEIEWQFDDADLERVESWLEWGPEDLGIVVGPGAGPGAGEDLVDAYYDTEDWRLYRAGYAIRVRRTGAKIEATMKSLTSVGGGAGNNVRRRREISEPLESGEVETLLKARGPVGERLRTLVGTHDLRLLFEVHTHRQTFDLVLLGQADDSSTGEIVEDAAGNIRQDGARNGSRVGEVALDRTKIPLGGGDEAASLTRVEVEADASAAAPGLEDFVEAMEEALDLEPTRTSKYEAGLFATGLIPERATSAGPVDVDGSLSVGEVAFRVLRRQFAAMRAHEAGTRLGEDAEELHDMRVATRRMRAAIKLFQDALPERTRWFRGELKWVAGVLGEVRDLDVHIEQLKEWAAEADEDIREPFSRIVEAVEERRDVARERLLEALDSERYERFESSFGEMLRRGPTDGTDLEQDFEGPLTAGEPVLSAAPGLLSQPYRKWRKAAGRVNDDSRPEEYHDLRKKGKRLRYALEFLSDVYGEGDTDGLIKTLKKLQDGLGRHQDSIVAADFLEQLATGEGQKLPSQTVFAMGLLAQRNLQEATSLRASLPASDAYRALNKGKTWKDFEKVMKKKQRSADKAGDKGAK